MTEATTDIALQAVTTQIDDNFRSSFEIERNLPEALKPLELISRNFYWSWQPEGTALFRDLSPGLWQEVEQNPRVLLKKISDLVINGDVQAGATIRAKTITKQTIGGSIDGNIIVG